MDIDSRLMYIVYMKNGKQELGKKYLKIKRMCIKIA